MARLTKATAKTRMEKMRRAKTSFDLCPTNSFSSFKWHVRTDVPNKEVSDYLKSYIKKNFSKTDAEIALKASDHAFAAWAAATFYWVDELKMELPDSWSYNKCLDLFRKDVMKYGRRNVILESKPVETKPTPTVQDRLYDKVNETILKDLDLVFDEWIEGKKTTYDVYGNMQKHGLKAPAAAIVLKFINKPLSELKGVINKDDAQLVEGYSHLTKKELQRRITELEKMVTDLTSFSKATKAVRAPRAKKPVAVEKLVSKVKFKKMDNDFKIASVDPAKIIGSRCVYLFNTKTRSLSVIQSDEQLTISGSSIKNFNEEKSVSLKLRKPDVFLPIVLSKTSGQIEKEMGKLTTKPSPANGRLNEDTVIIKVI